MDEFGRTEANQTNRPRGVIWQLDNPSITVWAKTWSEVLHANQQRLRLFQDKLELNADKDSSLQFLKETYSNVLGAASVAVTSLCEVDLYTNESHDTKTLEESS